MCGTSLKANVLGYPGGDDRQRPRPPEREGVSVSPAGIPGLYRASGSFAGIYGNHRRDWAVILQNPCYGDQREYVRDIVQKYPKTFCGFGMLDPRNIGSVSEQIDILMRDFNCIGVKMEIPDVPFIMDAPEYDFMWKNCWRTMPLQPSTLDGETISSDFNIDRLTHVVKKYPELKLILCHLGVSRLWDLKQTAPFPHLLKTLSSWILTKTIFTSTLPVCRF